MTKKNPPKNVVIYYEELGYDVCGVSKYLMPFLIMNIPKPHCLVKNMMVGFSGQENQLVALIPYSDQRLRPRRT